MSLGVATLEPSWSAETLVSEADRALYAAKGWGRNRAISVLDLDRQRLRLDILDEGVAEFDPNDPMGLAAIISAGLRAHPQALGIEPESQLAGGLLATLELKDVETRDHSERVMWYAMRLAQSVIESGTPMTHQELRALAYGALLHDIGKIGVPEHILKHPGNLDLEMKAVIREHPRLGAQIVQRFPTLDMALAVIRHHHERWDGRGYPTGLRGTDIPLTARIFSVVDGLEAMLSFRPYSGPMPIEEVTAELLKASGTIYDPAMLGAFQLVPAQEWVRIAARESVVAKTIGKGIGG
jgi:putative nucleotidyltransferase with HDIG domain